MLRLAFVIGLLAGLTVVLVLTSNLLIRDSRMDARRDDQRTSAMVAAAHVEDVLTRTIDREQHLARMVAEAWNRDEIQAKEVLDLYPKLLFESDLHLIRPRGELVWSMNSLSVRAPRLASETAVVAAAASLESSLSECASETSIGLACIASPIVGSDGELSAVLLAEIDLEGEAVDLLSLESLNDDFVITLMSGSGVVLASNDQGFDAHAIGSTTASEPVTPGDVEAESLVVPIDLVPGWTIVLQPRETVAVAIWTNEASWLLVVGLAASVLASIAAWATLRRMSPPMIVAPFASIGAPRALIQRQIDERQQLSNELGEDAAQSLAALAMTLGDLDSAHPQQARSQIARARTLALQVMNDLRGLTTRLHPSTLSDFGLAAGLRSFAESRFAGTSVDVHVAAVGMTPIRDRFVESVLFRAAQELIDNIYEHSGASAVLITTRMSEKRLTLTVEDDGSGFDTAAVSSGASECSGIGIALVRQLVSALGGAVDIRSRRGRGTRVVITVPH